MPNINAVNTTGKVAALSQDLLENEMNFVTSINQKYSGNFKAPEAIGDTVTIREKLSPAVNEVRTAAPQPFYEGSVDLKIDQRRNVSDDWETLETNLDIRDFMDRVADPKICALAANVEAYTLDKLVKTAPIFSAASTSLGDLLTARAHLETSLADMSNIKALLNPLDSAKIVEGVADRFNSAKDIADQYKKGEMGSAYGMNFATNTQLRDFVTGTSVDRVGALAADIAEGDESVDVSGFTNSATILGGEAFTIPGIYSVNPQSKVANTSELKQFIAASDVTLSGTGTGTIPLSAPVYFGATSLKNTSAQPTSGLVATLLGAGSAAYKQNLIYDPNFGTIAFVDPKKKLGNIACEKFMKNGIGIRYGVQGDLSEDMALHRFDLYFGVAGLRGDLARRVIDFT